MIHLCLQKYNKTIIDLKQPLLVSNLKEKDIRGGQADKIILVPELCRATGLTEDMRTNFRTMKELSTYTRVGPASRFELFFAYFSNKLFEFRNEFQLIFGE